MATGSTLQECCLIVAPLERGDADAVMGLAHDGNRELRNAGGMPLYKYVGNRILIDVSRTTCSVLSSPSELHSRYRAYSVTPR